MFLKTISHTEMLSLWRRGLRNGAIRRLHFLRRGLFSAALEYSKIAGRIVNPKLVDMIEGVADQIRSTIGRRIFRFGLNQASAIVRNTKAMEVFPSLRRWINDDSYVFWLGTNLLANRRAWLYIWG
jgi:hypothetical protein